MGSAGPKVCIYCFPWICTARFVSKPCPPPEVQVLSQQDIVF